MILSSLLGLIFIILVIIVAGTIYFINKYNKIIKQENQMDNAYGSIQANLKKRHDLIPNLVSSVKQYMEHESETLEKVVALRKKAQSEDLSKQKRAQVESDMTQALDSLMVQVEDYPNLKASDNFIQLQQSLNEVEKQLADSRQFYNTAVKQYNDSIETFPANIIAATYNFEPGDMFEAEDHEHKNPNVKSLFVN